MILIGGLFAVVGALITIVSDLILIGKPTNVFSFFHLGTETMVGISPWRITLGTFLGVAGLPLQLGGLVNVYYGLKPAGKWAAVTVATLCAYGLVMGVAFHIAYGFIGSSWQFYYEMELGNKLVQELINRFTHYYKLITTFMLTSLVLCSLGFSIMVLRGKTLFPKWLAIFSPLGLCVFWFVAISQIPAPVGGYVASAFFNTCTLIFFVLVTIVLYKKMKTDAPKEELARDGK